MSLFFVENNVVMTFGDFFFSSLVNKERCGELTGSVIFHGKQTINVEVPFGWGFSFFVEITCGDAL